MTNKRKRLQNSVERFYAVRQAMLKIKEQIEQEAEEKGSSEDTEETENKNRHQS